MSASQTTIICGVTCDCAVKPAVTQAASATGCEAKTGCKFASAGQCSCAAGVCQASAAKQTCKKATSVSLACRDRRSASRLAAEDEFQG